jgi:hypothetical protein
MPLMHELGLMSLDSWSDSIETGMANLSTSGVNVPEEFCLRAPTPAIAKVLLRKFISRELGGPDITIADLVPSGGNEYDYFVAGSGLQSLFMDDQSFDMYVITFLCVFNWLTRDVYSEAVPLAMDHADRLLVNASTTCSKKRRSFASFRTKHLVIMDPLSLILLPPLAPMSCA